jgi:hypothetical protein
MKNKMFSLMIVSAAAFGQSETKERRENTANTNALKVDLSNCPEEVRDTYDSFIKKLAEWHSAIAIAAVIKDEKTLSREADASNAALGASGRLAQYIGGTQKGKDGRFYFYPGSSTYELMLICNSISNAKDELSAK